jgi:hypothetical protein
MTFGRKTNEEMGKFDKLILKQTFSAYIRETRSVAVLLAGWLLLGT